MTVDKEAIFSKEELFLSSKISMIPMNIDDIQWRGSRVKELLAEYAASLLKERDELKERGDDYLVKYMETKADFDMLNEKYQSLLNK